LVIGSGVAGLIYALKVAKLGSVTILCKGAPTEGNTQYAQGGIASVTSPLDSFESHINDTIVCGAGLCNEEMVRSIISDGPSAISELISFGTNFDRSNLGDFELGQEGGHSVRRILHSKDATGAEIQRALFSEAKLNPNIEILDHHVAIDLIVANNQVNGVYALCAKTNKIFAFQAKLTMLATGGVGKVYLYTSNPDVATGDGIGMAYRANAAIGNMEFIQFHPTCLFDPGAKSFLISEALRGEGAILKTRSGIRFMEKYHPAGELAPRDIVARAIDEQMKMSGDDYVLLDISHQSASFIKDRFPTIYERLKSFGFDLTTGPIPVVPAAHYCCGGVKCDKLGRTTLDRLLVAGESAFSGLHGANRLASNSLLEALVLARNAAAFSESIIGDLQLDDSIPPWDYLDTTSSNEEVLISHSWDEVRRLMWNLVGIVRSDKRLKLAKRRLNDIKLEVRDYYWNYRVTSDLIELRNIIDVAEMIVICAISRKESRGLHFNSDYPKTNDSLFKTDSIIKLQP
jgi:L-aspartate oxidase